jgi:hypothetical protein
MTDRRKRLIWLGLILIFAPLLGAGCFHHFGPNPNNPGDVDVSEPPPQTDEPERVHPSPATTAGHAVALLLLRPMWEIGSVPNGDSRQRSWHWGAEVYLGGTTNTEPPGTPLPILAGANAGCSPCWRMGPLDRRWYAEADLRVLPLTRLSFGWSFMPAADLNGPQITLGLGELLHLRWYHHGEDGDWALLGGLSFPLMGLGYSPW